MLPFRASASGECNQIQSGLWSGVNAALGTNYNCSTVAQQSPAATSPTTQSGLYIALGDSVAAGLGLPVASTNDETCGVSAQAYPTVVAAATQRSYINAACSGATSGDLVTEQHLSGTSRDIEPQLDMAFANGVPALVSITAGANDVYWQYFAGQCYRGTCGSAAQDVTFNGLIAVMQQKYEYALSEINNRSGGTPPQVILTGYYQPFSVACSTQFTAVTPAEISWMNAKTARMNAVIQSVAAKYPFVAYAPVDFTGHELCTADPWVQGLTDDAPIHPTAAGQQAIGNAVVSAIKPVTAN